MKYLIFDVETESTNLALSRPWQFAAILCDEQKILNEYNLLIDIPNLKISKDAERITVFNRETFEEKKISVEKACEQIHPLISSEDKIILGHNILGFDVYQIRNLFKIIDVEIPWELFLERCIDTHCLARGLANKLSPPQKQPQFLLWNYKMLNKIQKNVKTSLQFLAGEYEIPFDPSKLHDALYDITINFEVFKKIKYEMDLNFDFLIKDQSTEYLTS
jgi:DNA polymerase III epsilon subunit-like protein